MQNARGIKHPPATPTLSSQLRSDALLPLPPTCRVGLISGSIVQPWHCSSAPQSTCACMHVGWKTQGQRMVTKYIQAQGRWYAGLT